jgi:AcrR family transcriptional regulator
VLFIMASRISRRPRDPEATREAILDAAHRLLARSGPEGVSLSEVARLAGVNRGTAYQHFDTREGLIEATLAWASDKLFRAAFGDPETIGTRRVEEVDVAGMTDRLTAFAMANPDLGRVWMLQILASPNPSADKFWGEYVGSLRRFAATDLSQDGVDAEVLAVLTLAGTFLWPVWANAHAGNLAERSAMARRLADETLRLSLFGSMRAAAFPEIAGRLQGRVEIPVTA